MIVTVLDACVLFPASVRDTLLRAAAAGLFQLQWTDEILAESMVALVEGQAQHLRKPQKTTLDVLKSLKIHVPQFASKIETMLHDQETE